MISLSRALVIALCLWTTSFAQAGVETWYTYWGLGFANLNYTGNIDNDIDSLKANAGYKHDTSMSADLFGFYWPVFEQNTIMGVVLNGATDNFRSSSLNIDLSVTASQLSYSTMYFFGAEPGDNFFVRGDIGLGRIGATATDSNNISVSGATNTGIGVRLGCGYGILVSEESRVLITLLFGKNNSDDGDATFTSLLVGGLW